MPEPAAPPATTVLATTVLATTVLATTVLATTVPPPTPPATVVLATVMDTPIGPLSLLARDGRLIAGGFTTDPAEMHARLALALRALPLQTTGPAELPWLAKPVAAYFDGDLAALDAIPVSQPGSPSRQRLWAALRAVPPGRTVSYTQLAAQGGNPRAPRAAGAACAYNLIAPVVPCHRALRSNGTLGGYYYGLDRKRWLLRHEGVGG